MLQHAAAKRAHPDAVVFFRLGDFYEMFEGDALLCAPLLDLTLTSRNKGKADEVPMCGVPHHSAHGYIGKLLGLGYKIALCEQLADPSMVKGIVPREVVRVLTPGTVTSGEHLDVATNNWLGGIHVEPTSVGLALLDIPTGELRAARFDDLAAVLGELARVQLRARSSSVGGSTRAFDRRRRRGGVSRPRCAPAVLGHVAAGANGRRRFDDDAVQCRARVPRRRLARRLDAAVRLAVARTLRYARACSPGAPLPVRRIAEWNPREHLIVDPVAQRHLELVESRARGKRGATLLSVIDATARPPGARLLRRRLLSPLIGRREDSAAAGRQVELLVDDAAAPRPTSVPPSADVGDHRTSRRVRVLARRGDAARSRWRLGATATSPSRRAADAARRRQRTNVA